MYLTWEKKPGISILYNKVEFFLSLGEKMTPGISGFGLGHAVFF